jgi:glycosyltransferase involved in cell wall biosynthesis
MEPLVSVCIITYNHGKFIRQCLEGVMMQQTSFPFEVVIGEDCSTDNTKDIIREFAERFPCIIKPVYLPANVGGARNGYEFCFPRLTGKYVAICEGDDYWTDPFKLQKQVAYLEQHPEHSFCFHRVASVDEHDRLLQAEQSTEEAMFYKADEIFHISIPTLAVVFRKYFDVVPDELFQVQSGDTFLFGLLARHGGAADLGFLGAHYRRHPGGSFSSRKLICQYRQTIHTRKVMKKAACFNESEKNELKKEIRKRKTRYIKHFIKKGQLINVFRILAS